MMDYLEGSLPEPELKEFIRHLEGCISCRDFSLYLKETLAGIELSRICENDPFFYTRLKARMERPQEFMPSEKKLVRILQPAFFSLFLAAAIYAGILIGRSYPVPENGSLAIKDISYSLNEMGNEPIETFLMN